MEPTEDPAKLIERMGAQASGMAEKIQNISGVASDDDELVTATCGPGNKLIDIDFTPKSRRLDTHELKEKVLVAIQRAGDSANQQLTDIIGEFSAGFGGMRSIGDMKGLQQSMTDAQAKIAEQRAKLEQMYADLKNRS